MQAFEGFTDLRQIGDQGKRTGWNEDEFVLSWQIHLVQKLLVQARLETALNRLNRTQRFQSTILLVLLIALALAAGTFFYLLFYLPM